MSNCFQIQNSRSIVLRECDTDSTCNNYTMSFLLVLDEEDYISKFKNCFFSNNNKILTNKKLFKGEIKTIPFQEINNTNLYQISGPVIPNIIYIKLPKENIYVEDNKYQERYITSKINELQNIFAKLKPKSIKITIKMANNNSNNFSIGGNVDINNISGGVEYNNSTTHQNKFSNYREMKFSKSSTPINTNFSSTSKYYYLQNEPEWKELIKKRIRNGLIKDKYTYTYTNSYKVSKKLKSKLKIFDIEFNFNNSMFENLQIEYDIEYYELESTDELDNIYFANTYIPLVDNDKLERTVSKKKGFFTLDKKKKHIDESKHDIEETKKILEASLSFTSKLNTLIDTMAPKKVMVSEL